MTAGDCRCGIIDFHMPTAAAVRCCCCRALAVWLQKVDPKTDGAARDWVAIYDECRCAT
jgi:hypothetical protein